MSYKIKPWTREEILNIASKRKFIVHKYKWSCEKLRKLTRRMCKDGLLKMVLVTRDEFFYVAIKNKETKCIKPE